MSDNIDRELFAEAILGKQADIWWQSDVGQYVVARAKAEIDAVIEQLKEAPASDVVLIHKLQTQWKTAEAALVWIQEAIVGGKEATAQLEIRNEIAG